MGQSSGEALAPVRLTDELESDLRKISKDLSTDEQIRLRQEAFMRAREKQYGDPLATVEVVGHGA